MYIRFALVKRIDTVKVYEVICSVSLAGSGCGKTRAGPSDPQLKQLSAFPPN